MVVLAPGEEAPELSLVDAATGEVLVRIPTPDAAFIKGDQRAGLTRSGDQLLRLSVPTRIRRRVLAVDVSLDFVAGALGGDWTE